MAVDRGLVSGVIRERILIRLQSEGGTFDGTTRDIFETLGLGEEYWEMYSSVLYDLKKTGQVGSNPGGVGYWLVKAETKAESPSIVVAAVNNLVVELDKLREENAALNKENEDLARRFMEIQEILNRA